jgi:hypothetical protein
VRLKEEEGEDEEGDKRKEKMIWQILGICFFTV